MVVDLSIREMEPFPLCEDKKYFNNVGGIHMSSRVGWLRISPRAYNTVDEADGFLEALRSTSSFFRFQ